MRLNSKNSLDIRIADDVLRASGRIAPLSHNTIASRFYPDIKVTKTKGFGQHHLAIKWQRDDDGFHSDEPWILLTNLPDLETALKAYAKGFRIEELFRDRKLGGYCLEVEGFNNRIKVLKRRCYGIFDVKRIFQPLTLDLHGYERFGAT